MRTSETRTPGRAWAPVAAVLAVALLAPAPASGLAAPGAFFPDWEFEKLFGMRRAPVAEVAAAWPAVEQSEDEVRLAINNALTDLTGYPHGQEEAWGRYISVSASEVAGLLRKWRERAAATAAGP